MMGRGAARMRKLSGWLTCAATSWLLTACMPATGGPEASAPAATPADARNGDPDVLPAGFGTLRQDDITVSMRHETIQVRVTPLADWILPLTVPDTHRRLSATVARLDPGLRSGRVPVLVSLFTEMAGGVPFEAGELTLVNRGRRYRPVSIQGLTSGWEQGRLDQGRPAQALYLFDASLDLEMDLVVEFGHTSTTAWNGVIPRLQTERARVRGRIGADRAALNRPDRTS